MSRRAPPVTPDGRYYIAGLFGEDGLALIDLWDAHPHARKILQGYGRGQEPLPVYKMPHLRGWAVAGHQAWLPAIGRHEVLIVDTDTWTEVGRVPVAGQPVFVMARPDGRQVWVNFAVPDYHRVQVIDVPSRQIVRTLVEERKKREVDPTLTLLRELLMQEPGTEGSAQPELVGFYRWHVPDPVVFRDRLRVTIQQLGAAMFPFLMPSVSNPSHSLTVWNASSTQKTLGIMLFVTIVFLPIVLAYGVRAADREDRAAGREHR